MANFSELHELLRSCIVFCAGTRRTYSGISFVYVQNSQWLIKRCVFFIISLGVACETNVGRYTLLYHNHIEWYFTKIEYPRMDLEGFLYNFI